MSQEKSYNRTLGAIRRFMVLVIVVALVLPARPTLTSLAAGFALVVLGEGTRFWAAGYLLKTMELVTAGPYRHTRNPLYLGRLLIFTGLAIMANLPFYLSYVALAVGWVTFFGYYLRRKERVEPARLKETHGEAYQRYFDAVPALFPSLRPYAGATPLEWSKERMLRNREHLMVLGLLAAAAVLSLKSTFPFGF